MSGILLAALNSASASPGLYDFSAFTFTNAAMTGHNGPSLAQCKSAYNTSTYPWINDTAFFNMLVNGIQRWTVPKTGSYRFTALGASGGTANNSYGYGAAGLAAQMQSTFTLTEGDVIQIAVGQMGSNGLGSTCGGDGSGGGGTFVVTAGGVLLLASGGGGGAASNAVGQAEYKNAVDGTSGRNGSGNPPYGGTGGVGGLGGTYNSGSCVPVGSTGAGFSSNGSGSGPSNATSFANGLFGGNQSARSGGFGGGGCSGSSYCGGGGGGYSGGGGGGLSSCSCSNMAAGGAGGSYSANAYSFALAGATGHGSVLVEKL